MALKTTYADSWTTITGHKEHSLCFEALQRAHPVMTWTRSHQEKRNPIKDDWTRDEWGNYIAGRLAGAFPMEMSEITNGRAVHFKVTARDGLRSLLPPHQWYIGDPFRGPGLTIGEEVKAWQEYWMRRGGYSMRPV